MNGAPDNMILPISKYVYRFIACLHCERYSDGLPYKRGARGEITNHEERKFPLTVSGCI